MTKNLNNTDEQVTFPFTYEVSYSIKGIRARQYCCADQTGEENKTKKKKKKKFSNIKRKVLQVLVTVASAIMEEWRVEMHNGWEH